MKRVFALLIALLLISTLVACTGTGADHGKDTETKRSDGGQSTSDPDVTQPETPSGSRVLVAYFSRTGENYGVGVIEKGNTEIIAEMIASKTGGDLFRIESVNAYPASYDDCTQVAREEKNANARPGLTATVENFDDYDVIYLGYPIWWGDMPMPVYTFLESYDFSGKTVIPFCNHAGSGISGTPGRIRNTCGGAAVSDGFAILGTTAQKDRAAAEKQVLDWLEQ